MASIFSPLPLPKNGSDLVEIRSRFQRGARVAGIFVAIFLPAALVTAHFNIFEIFISWVRQYQALYLDELVSMLILCLLPFLSYVSFRLYQLNTALSRNEQTILRLSHQNELILNSAGDGIFGLDREGCVTFINPSAARMMNRSRNSLEQKHFKEVINPTRLKDQPGECPPCAIEATFREGVPHSVDDESFRRPNGSEFPVEYTSTPIFQGGQLTGAVVTFRDIAARKRTAAELHRLAAAIRQTADMIIISNKNGIIQYVNPAFEKTAGYSQAEVLGRHAGFLEGKQQSHSFAQNLVRTLLRGEIWKNRFISNRKDGAPLYVDMTISPVRDPEGTITHYVGVMRDITREVELGRQLRQAQRLEAVGTLAGGIAHDFNNILTAILSYTDLAMDDLEPNDQSYKNLDEVLTAAHRGRDLIRHLMAFSRRGERELAPLHLGPVINEAITLLQAVLPANIAIRTQLEGNEQPVMADATQIHQVVMNLCTNGAQAMGEHGGRLEVLLEKTHIDNNASNGSPLVPLISGHYMRLTVKDNGPGIPPEVIQRIFEPFFTTKGVGKGTGLGLSVVHGIIQNHRGNITVASKVAEGTVFRIFLPIAENSFVEPDPTPASA